MVTYARSLIATLPVGAVSSQALIVSDGGPNMPWWALVLVMPIGTGVLNVHLSARVIGERVAFELIVVFIYGGFDTATGGHDDEIGLTPLDPTWASIASFRRLSVATTPDSVHPTSQAWC